MLENLNQSIMVLEVCPICGEETFIDSNYCRNCGWTFIPMFPTKNISSEEHLQISRRNWKLISQLSCISNLEDMDDIYERFQKAMSESSLLKQENERLLQENKYIENKSRLNDSLEAENAWQDSCKSEKGILRKAGSFILNGMMRGDGIILDQKEKQTPNLNRWNLVDAVIESCPTRRGSIFGRDKLQKVGFDENRLREIMKTKYGITLNSKELSVCITIDDLKKYVAQLTGTKLF